MTQTLQLGNYFTELVEQRKLNPKFPKLYKDYPFAPDIRYIGSVTTNILTDSFEYVGITKIGDTLYPLGHIGQNGILNDDNIINDYFSLEAGEDYKNITHKDVYYEFVNTKPTKSTTLNRWRFLYIPAYVFSAQVLRDKLPHIKEWDVRSDNPKLLTLYPERLNLLNSTTTVSEIHSDQEGEDGRTHPFLPFMLYTGSTSVTSEGTEVYNYFDSKGYYGPIDLQYASYLRPIDLSYPLGPPINRELYTDDCWQDLINEGPEYDQFVNEVKEYSFTGYITNAEYSDDKTYYLYTKESSIVFEGIELPLDISYLHEARPHSRAKEFITSLKVSNNFDIDVITTLIEFTEDITEDIDNVQQVFINQRSLCNPIQIEDNSYDLINIEIVGDCIFLNNNYLLDPCTYDIPINKTITGLFGDCVLIDNFWNYHGKPPTGIHPLNSILILGDDYYLVN